MKTRMGLSMIMVLMVMLLAVAGVPLALAETDIAEEVNHFGQALQGQEIPKPVASFLGDQKVNVHILQNNGEELIVGIVTEQGKIKNLIVAEVKDPTLVISTDESTIKTILSSDNLASTIQQALADKKITYKAVGFSNKVKFWVAKTAAKVLSLFNEEDSAEVEVFAKVDLDAAANGTSADDSGDDTESNDNTNNSSDASADGNSDSAPQPDAVAPAPAEEPDLPKVHTVKLIEGGFPVEEISIKVGETVQWLNVRSGRFDDGMIIGTMACSTIKSGIYGPGESYSYTFTKPGTCVIVDGIYTTETMDVIVS